MKLPGGVEFEFSELKQIGEQAQSVGLLRRPEQKYSFEEEVTRMLTESIEAFQAGGLGMVLNANVRLLGT